MASFVGGTSFVTKGLELAFPGRRRPRVPSQVTALDLDGTMLRVVHAAPRGNRIEVVRIEAVRLDLASDADRSDPAIIGKAVARALQSLGLTAASVVMGIPRAQVILRTLLLPSIQDIRELASMVHLQIGRELPFRMEDAVIDFKVRRQVGGGGLRTEGALAGAGGDAPQDQAPPPKLEVLVAAVKREVVDFFVQVSEEAGLKLSALGLLPYANARCVEACQVADGGQAFALVSLRPDEVTIDVISEESLLFSRGASIRPATEVTAPPDVPGDTPQQEGFSDQVTIEVVRSLHGYSGMEPGNPPAKVVVNGGTGYEPRVVEALGKRLSLPCMQLDPATALGVVGVSRELIAGATAAIGLALGLGDPRGLPFDFLHPKRPAVARDMGRIRLLAGVAAAAAIMVFVLAVRAYMIRQRTAENRSVALQLTNAEKNRPLYRRMMTQAAAVDEWMKPGPDWMAHYAHISAVMPPSEEVYLTSFSVGAQGLIRMTVQARSGELLTKMDKQLRAAGYEVKPLAISPGADRFGYEFRSNVELLVPEKLKIDLAKVKPTPRPADDGSLDPAIYRGGAR